MNDTPRWSGVRIEYVEHPLDAHHTPHAKPEVVAKAQRTILRVIQRIGYAEAFWVAEQICFEYGVGWDAEQANVLIFLTELQQVAYAAALRAHHDAMTPVKAKAKKKRKRKTKGLNLE